MEKHMKRIAFIFLFFCLISGGYVSAAERNDAGTELQDESFAISVNRKLEEHPSPAPNKFR